MNAFSLKDYPTGMPRVIHVKQYQHLADMLSMCCEEYADRQAFTSLGAHITYQELSEQAHVLAAAWQDAGLKKGDRLAIMMPNCLQYPIALFAAFLLGVVVVNVNPLSEKEDIIYQLQDADVTALLLMDLFLSECLAALPFVSLAHLFTTQMGDCMGGLKRPIVNVMSRRGKPRSQKILSSEKTSVLTWRMLLASGKKKRFKKVTVTLNDLAFLQYTQGTTGLSKGTLLTHQNVMVNAIQCSVWVEPALTGIKQGVGLAVIPFCHIVSITLSCFLPCMQGLRTVLVPDPRETKQLANLFAKEPVTVMFALNTFYNALLADPTFQYANFSQLRLCLSGCVPMHWSVADRWQRTTGVSILEGYGLTEASPVVAINPVSRHKKHFTGSVGLPLPSTEIKVVDYSGVSQPAGRPGEVWVRGPQVAQGYWKDPQATKQLIDSAAWLHTGDIGRLDAQGYLYLLERKVDLITVAGFTVYPSEVEEVLVSHRDVSEAAVVPVSQGEQGQQVVAVVVMRSGCELSEDALLALCRHQLAGYKVPVSVLAWPTLPKSVVGKIRRRLVSKMLQEQRMIVTRMESELKQPHPEESVLEPLV